MAQWLNVGRLDMKENPVAEMRLAIACILNSSWEDLVCTLGVCCSSWVFMNSGTSCRTFLTPMGNQLHASVRAANQMMSRRLDVYLVRVQKLEACVSAQPPLRPRCSLLLLLIQMAGGVWIVENPGSSLLSRHERFVWLINLLRKKRLYVPLLCQDFSLHVWYASTL